MAASMLAAVAAAGEHEFRLERVDVPEIGPGEALVRVEAVGLSRGLLARWFWTDMMPLLPGVLGHEIAGTVALLGAGVRGVREGDSVRVHTTLTCGDCGDCRDGQETLCRQQCTIGSVGSAADPRYRRYRNGGLAEYVRVPVASLDPIPTGLPMSVAAKASTLAMALRALRLAGAAPGSSLVIAAASGASGAATALLSRGFGAAAVVGVARRRAGLERLLSTGGLTAVVPTDELADGWQADNGCTDALLAAVGEPGADGLVDYCPLGADVTTQAIRALRPGGHGVLVGGNVSELRLSYLEVMRSQWRVAGMRGAARSDERTVLRLLAAGRLDAAPLVTHLFRLDDVNHAIETVMDRSDSPMFVVVAP